MILAIFILLFIAATFLWFKFNFFYHEFEFDSTKLRKAMLILFPLIIALATGLLFYVKKFNEQKNSWLIQTDEQDLCIEFQGYQYENDQSSTINDTISIDLPENKVIQQLVTTGKTMDLVITRKKDNLVLVIPLDVTELKNGTMQCNYDAIFTSELYTYKLNFDVPCNVTYAYTKIIPKHYKYIIDHQIVVRQCESVLLYITEDFKSFATATVYCMS